MTEKKKPIEVDVAIEYVLDSFALLAHLENEKRGTNVTNILKRAQDSEDIMLYMSAINLGEVYYITMRERGGKKAEEILSLIKLLPLQIVVPNMDLILKAAKLKAKYPAAYADCFAASLAIEKDASVITGDPEFKNMQKDVRVEWI